VGGYLSRGHSPEDTSSLADSDPEVHRGLRHFYPPPLPQSAKVQQALADEESQAEELACLLNLRKQGWGGQEDEDKKWFLGGRARGGQQYISWLGGQYFS